MRYHNRAMAYLGGVIIGAMMVLVVTEVLSRYLTGKSIEGTIEMVSIFLALAIFLGFSPCEEADHHVKVELVVRLFPKKYKFVSDVIIYVLAILTIMVTSWQVGIAAIDSWKIKETLPGASIQVPVFHARAVCFIGYLAFLVQLTINLVGIVRNRKRTFV